MFKIKKKPRKLGNPSCYPFRQVKKIQAREASVILLHITYGVKGKNAPNRAPTRTLKMTVQLEISQTVFTA
jgi:hypothetical protein